MQDLVIRKSLDLISAANTLTLPVDTRRIATHFRYSIRYYGHCREMLKNFNMTHLAAQYPALSTKRHGKYYIFLSDDLNVEQERREIAHELGHITLGHLEPDVPIPKEDEAEEQADLFVIALLAAPPLLEQCGVSCPEDIHRITGLSLTDSRQAFSLLEHYRLRQYDAAIAHDIARRARVAARPRPLGLFLRRAY